MKKLIIILFFVMFIFVSIGHGFETIRNPANNNEFMNSCFSNPCIANPGEILFNHTERWAGGLFSYKEYRFLGRTGDKTFEISFRNKQYGIPETTRRLNLYFEKNGEIQLEMGPYNEKFWPPFGRIILKTIDLQNNQLKYQVIIPPR